METTDASSIDVPVRSAWRGLIDEIKLVRGCEDTRCYGFPPGYPRVLSFDHRPGVEKLFEISQVPRRRRTGAHVPVRGTGGSVAAPQRVTWAETIAEIEKCDVVCKNCHEVRNTERDSSAATRP